MPTRGMLSSIAAVALASIASLTLSGCGGSPTTSSGSGGTGDAYAKYAAMTGSQRTSQLLAAARNEGALAIYTSNTDIGDLVKGFEKAYSGIKVNVYRANSETVLQRVSQEAAANKTANDIVDTNDFELDAMSKQHLLTPYDGPGKAGLRPEASFPDWTASRFNAFVVGWNTKLVPKGQEPKSLEELATPKWKGRISMEMGDWDWYLAWHTYLTTKKGMSDAQATQLFRSLAANAKVVKGHTVQGELLSSGQFGVALSVYSHTVDKATAKGAPVAWRPAVQPVMLRPNGLALMSKPKHPAAATLWMDWVLTAGQKFIADAKRIPAAKSVPGYTTPIPPGTETFDVPLDKLRTESKKWETAYDELVRGAKGAGG
ncbi:MAG TPA: extracellular solute-binding protein [Streptosporangiaceae bacterium]